MNEQLHDDYRRIMKPRETTVREWLHDVARRQGAREPWETEALERVLPHLIAVVDEAREVIRYCDDEAHGRLHEALRFLQTPIGWLRDD